jgi:L-lysine exporter family protein LysE/ArgO
MQTDLTNLDSFSLNRLPDALLAPLAGGSAGPGTALLWLQAGVQGFLLSLTLIVAIGAQNAFVLRQALKREHISLAGLLGERPGLARALAGAGCIFLLVYGARALQRATRPGSLQAAASSEPSSRRATLAALAGFTLLNPHVYLDTVMLVGSVGAQQPTADARLAFIAGVAAASAAWFFALGYGARFLAQWFAKPRTWQVLEVLIGLMMFALALQLLPRVFGAV